MNQTLDNGLPAGLLGAPLLLCVIRPRLGPAGILAFSAALWVFGAALGCLLPWTDGPVTFLLYVVTWILSALPVPSFLPYLAHKYPLEEQARVQGLVGLVATLGGGAAVVVYAYLYDPRADGVHAALPFLVSFGSIAPGAMLFVSALWHELPTCAIVTRRRPEVMLDEDRFQLEWRERVEGGRPLQRDGAPVASMTQLVELAEEREAGESKASKATAVGDAPAANARGQEYKVHAAL